MHPRRRALPRLLAACGVAALGGVLGGVLQAPDAGARSPGTWGPDRVPYSDGVICTTPTARTALVSWAGADGPAFATSIVSGPPQGLPGPTANPAVGGTSRAVSASGSLGPSQIATLAYLISHHGQDDSPTVGDVAATVVDQVTPDSTVTSCLDSRQGGMAPETAGRLLAEATDKAGPYTVTVSSSAAGALTAGKSAVVTATVTGSAGRPVAGLQVGFDTSNPSASLSSPNGVTDARGQVATTVRIARSASSERARVTASLSAVTGLIQTIAPSKVSLFSAAPPTTYRGSTDVAIDTVPDPHLSLSAAATLVLADDPLRSTLGVSGMNGHSGVATVSAYGPLKVVPRTGCSTHTAAEWAALRTARKAVSSAQIVVGKDGAFTVPDTGGLTAGCYQLGATIATTDATPNVSRSVVGPTVAAVPMSVGLAPATTSLQPVGPLTATVQVKGAYAGELHAVQARLLGPRAPDNGQCPSIGWNGTGASRAGVSTTSLDATHVRLTSGAVTAPGCYAFRVDAQVTLPELGNAAVHLDPGADDPAVLTIAPSVAVTDLSTTGVKTGDRATATVQVTSTEDQRGTLTLQLRHLPYTYRGCFAADWTHSAVVSSTSAPLTATAGDRVYTVRSPTVPTTGCWTVVPVFRAAANPKVVATGTPGVDPMLAFTGLERTRSAPVAAVSRRSTDDTVRIGITGVLLAAALLITITTTLSLAGRERVQPYDPLATLHL